MKKEYNISAKLTLSLGEKIDELAAKHYKNKTAFIEAALTDYVSRYECDTTQERASPRSKAIQEQAIYIMDVLLVGKDCSSILEMEVKKLCLLLI